MAEVNTLGPENNKKLVDVAALAIFKERLEAHFSKALEYIGSVSVAGDPKQLQFGDGTDDTPLSGADIGDVFVVQTGGTIANGAYMLSGVTLESGDMLICKGRDGEGKPSFDVIQANITEEALMVSAELSSTLDSNVVTFNVKQGGSLKGGFIIETMSGTTDRLNPISLNVPSGTNNIHLTLNIAQEPDIDSIFGITSTT